MTDLLPLSGPSLRERVTQVLEERMLFGDWAPGTQLPSEPELCAQLEVSRSVVRDAIRTLAARGLVDVRQGVGTTVAASSSTAYSAATFLLLLRSGVTVHDAVVARAAIEHMVAGIAAEARTGEDLRVLRHHFGAVAAAATADDMPAALEADAGFHLRILESTHQPVLIELLRPMQEIFRITSLPPASGDGLESPPLGYGEYQVELHRGVLEALEAGDPELARERMEAHFAFIHDPKYRRLHSLSIRDAAKVRASLREEIRRRAA